MTRRRRQDRRHRRRADRSTTTCMRSGSIRPIRNHLIIGNDGGVAIILGRGQDLELRAATCRSGSSTTSATTTRRRTTSAAACRTTTTGAARARCAARSASPIINWTTMQGGDGFVALQDPNDFRIVYSESQDGNMVRVDRVTGETISIRPAAPTPGEPPLRWNWDTPLILSPHDAEVRLRRRQQGVPFRRPRLNSWTAGQPDLTGNADRDQIVTMGVKGSDIRIARDDGIAGLADDRVAGRVAEARRRRSTPAPTTARCRCRSDGGKTGPNVADRICRAARRASGCPKSCRRGSTKARCTRPSTATARTTSRPTST